jgi:hypothetical protein
MIYTEESLTCDIRERISRVLKESISVIPTCSESFLSLLRGVCNIPLWKRGIEGDFLNTFISIKSPLAPLCQRGVQKDPGQAGMTDLKILNNL